MNIKITSKSGLIPQYETEGAAGFDFRADIAELGCIVLAPGDRKLIPTGLSAEIPEGYEIQVRPRSGLALKAGISLVNSPGTIDSDYRGDIGIILINHGDSNFTINHKDRIAQGVLCKVERARFQLVTELSSSNRGEGGFGHTGKQ